MSVLTGLITLDRQPALRPTQSPAVTAAPAGSPLPLNFSLMMLLSGQQPPAPGAPGQMLLPSGQQPLEHIRSGQTQAEHADLLLPLQLHGRVTGGSALPPAGDALPPLAAFHDVTELSAGEAIAFSLDPSPVPDVAPQIAPAIADAEMPAIILLSAAPTGLQHAANLSAVPGTQEPGDAAAEQSLVALMSASADAEQGQKPTASGLIVAALDNPAGVVSGHAVAEMPVPMVSTGPASGAADDAAAAVEALMTPIPIQLSEPLKSAMLAPANGDSAATTAPVSLLNESKPLELAARVRSWRDTAAASGISDGQVAVIAQRQTPVAPGQLQVFAEQLQAANLPAADAAMTSQPQIVTAEDSLPAAPSRQEPAVASTQPRQAPAAAFNPHTFSQTLGHAIDEPQWGESFARHISLLTGQKVSSAEVQLDPPELGSLLVRINITGDQASISFVSPHLQVRDSIEQSFDRLQNMLSEQGLDLVDVDVSDQSSREREGSQSSDQPVPLPETVAESESAPVARQVGLVDYYI